MGALPLGTVARVDEHAAALSWQPELALAGSLGPESKAGTRSAKYHDVAEARTHPVEQLVRCDGSVSDPTQRRQILANCQLPSASPRAKTVDADRPSQDARACPRQAT